MSIRIWEKFKAWRRGETMVAGVNRGRCFVKKPTAGAKAVPAKAEAKLTQIKIIRADGSVEIKHLGKE